MTSDAAGRVAHGVLRARTRSACGMSASSSPPPCSCSRSSGWSRTHCASIARSSRSRRACCRATSGGTTSCRRGAICRSAVLPQQRLRRGIDHGDRAGRVEPRRLRLRAAPLSRARRPVPRLSRDADGPAGGDRHSAVPDDGRARLGRHVSGPDRPGGVQLVRHVPVASVLPDHPEGTGGRGAASTAPRICGSCSRSSCRCRCRHSACSRCSPSRDNGIRFSGR